MSRPSSPSAPLSPQQMGSPTTGAASTPHFTTTAIPAADSSTSSWTTPTAIGQLLRSLLKVGLPATATQFMRAMSVVIAFAFASSKLTPTEFAGISLGLSMSNITLLTFGMGIGSVLDTISCQLYGHDPLSSRLGLYYRRAVITFLLWSILVWSTYPLWSKKLMILVFGESVGSQTALFLLYSPFQNIPQGLHAITMKSLNAQKKSLYPLISQTVMTVLMFPCCGLGIQYGVFGLALGMGIARFLGFLTLCVIAWLDTDIVRTFGTWSIFRDALDFSDPDCGKFFRLLPSSVAICAAERWAFEVLSIFSGLLGSPSQQNAYTIAVTLSNNVFALAMGGYTAANAIVGGALAAGDSERAKAAASLALKSVLLTTIILSALLLVLREPLVLLYTSGHDSAVTSDAVRVLQVACIMLVLDNLGFTFQGIFRACGDTKFLSKVIIASQWLVGIPVGAVLCFCEVSPLNVRHRGVQGLMIGLLAAVMVQKQFFQFKYFTIEWELVTERVMKSAKESSECGDGSHGQNALSNNENGDDADDDDDRQRRAFFLLSVDESSSALNYSTVASSLQNDNSEAWRREAAAAPEVVTALGCETILSMSTLLP